MSDVSHHLESQGCHLIPLCYRLSCASAQLCYPFCLIFSACWPFFLNFFPENSSIFFVKRQAFLYGFCLAIRRSELDSGMCSMLPYDTGVCYHAFIYILYIYVYIYIFFIASVQSFFFYFFIFFLNTFLTYGPRYQRVLALCAFLTGVIRRD